MMLDEIIVELSMCGRVLNLSIHLKECLNAPGVPLWLHLAINNVIEEFQV
jgi:hypothetical protein